MKYFLVSVSLSILLYSCSSDFSVKGNISNMPTQKFKVEELGVDENIPIDTGSTNEKGAFEFNHAAKEEALYKLTFEQNKYILLALNNGDKATLSGDWNTLENYQVEGSKSSVALKSFLVNLRENITDIKTLTMLLDSAKANKKDSSSMSIEKDLANVNASFMQYIKQFADTTKSVSSALFAVNLINPQFEGPYVKTFYQNIGKRFPNSTSAKQFAARFLGKGASTENETVLPKIGEPAPDFNAPSPDGKTISLSSLKGKYVLIDFWASWCGPCRKENPHVVNAFNQFKNKNFTILGVSLDSNKEKWMEAIQKDNLTWNHVSELQGWQSTIARNYGVEGIPSNFLVDPNGTIIATNLQGADLINKLQTTLVN